MVDRRKGGVRFDFEFGEVETDPVTGETRIEVMPNRERYAWVQNDRGRFLYDRFDDVYIEPHIVQEAIEYYFSHQASWQPQHIENAEDYWTSRVPLIRETLRNGPVPFDFRDLSEQFLEELSTDKLNFVVLSVDVVGSTKLATTMENDAYALLMKAALLELSEVVPKFRGYVLKYTGDGIIAYFAEPSFVTMNDLALDCALTIRGSIRNALNPVLKELSMPQIQIRVGIDSGETAIAVVGSHETKQHKDLIGQVVSLAAKIQALAKPDEILYGETVERHLHTNWRRHSTAIELPEDWRYIGPDGDRYKVYRCDLP